MFKRRLPLAVKVLFPLIIFLLLLLFSGLWLVNIAVRYEIVSHLKDSSRSMTYLLSNSEKLLSPQHLLEVALRTPTPYASLLYVALVVKHPRLSLHIAHVPSTTLKDEEVVRWIKNAVQNNLEMSYDADGNLLLLEPTAESSHFMGMVYSGAGLRQSWTRIVSFLLPLYLLLLCILVLFVYGLLYVFMLKPIETIRTAMVTSHKTKAEVPQHGRDEWGEFCDTFNTMLAQIDETQQQLVAIIENSPATIELVDFQGRYLLVNKRAEKILGQHVLGHNFSEYHSQEAREHFFQVIRTRQPVSYEAVVSHEEGTTHTYLKTLFPIGTEGVPHFVGIVGADITSHKVVERQLHYLAHHDALTGLPSMRLAMQNLKKALSLAKRNQQKLAVMFLDLDGFKGVNDTFGHEVGDAVLRKVSQLLLMHVREADTIARIGGDEFIIILGGLTHQDDSTAMLERVVHTLSLPLMLNEVDVPIKTISVSVGVAFYPDNATTPEALIKAADHAMYRAKASGKNSYATAEPLTNLSAL